MLPSPYRCLRSGRPEDKLHREVPELNVGIKEADLRLLPHAKYSIVRDKAKRIVILSNDTDILVGFFFLL